MIGPLPALHPKQAIEHVVHAWHSSQWLAPTSCWLTDRSASEKVLNHIVEDFGVLPLCPMAALTEHVEFRIGNAP